MLGVVIFVLGSLREKRPPNSQGLHVLGILEALRLEIAGVDSSWDRKCFNGEIGEGTEKDAKDELSFRDLPSEERRPHGPSPAPPPVPTSLLLMVTALCDVFL